MKISGILVLLLASFVFFQSAQALDEENFQLLLSYLNSNNPTLKKEAIMTIGEIKEKKAVPYLISLLEDKNPEIRVLICEALQDIGDERAVKPLIKKLEDPDQKVRNAARCALKEILRYKKH